jgi:hypothetical protein
MRTLGLRVFRQLLLTLLSKQQGHLRTACYRFFGPIVYMFKS